MALNFPNMSRRFDATRRAVRFWGYDRAMESSFFVTEDALQDHQPNMNFSEAGPVKRSCSHHDLYMRDRKQGMRAVVRGLTFW